MTDYVLKEDFVIPAGTVFARAPTETKRAHSAVQGVIAIGPDAIMFADVDIEDPAVAKLLTKI